MKPDWKNLAITGLVAIVAVGLYNNFLADKMPAVLRRFIG